MNRSSNRDDLASKVYEDQEDELSEAKRRDAELDANPALGLSLADFDDKISQRTATKTA